MSKIRYGFVSNSSSSSFIVKHKMTFDDTILSDEDVKKIKDYGFYETYAYYPDQVENNSDAIIANKDKNYNYGYYVTCNEDEPLEFLLNNNISFQADCHYGQYTLIYNKDQDYVTVCVNLGHLYLMQGKWIHESFKNKKCYEEIPKNEIISKGYYI